MGVRWRRQSHRQALRRSRAWTAFLLLVCTVLAFPLAQSQHNVLAQLPPYQDPTQPVPVRVADLMSRMTLDEKIGQMTQAERSAVSPDREQDIAFYNLGSLLSGGGSAPTPNTPEAWADMYDRFQSIAVSSRLGIPLIYGVDAVHGHNNLIGATIFPHNIGLGATGNPELVEEVGRVTAREVRGTGITWTFSPCLCVARDERWGRTYESFSEDPTLVVSMTSIIDGYQGTSLLSETSVLATAKHYIGDGATTNGDDQGNAEISEEELRAIHLPPFEAAIERDVGSIMVSYSSWNDEKLHGHTYLISDVLKGELGFDGFVISDWAAIDQLPGDYASDVRNSINAGIDMIMVPHNYALFINTLKAEVNADRVSMERIDDAVARILTKKFELGLFERPFTDRSYTAQIGSLAHRTVARQAVRESLVLLKNEGDLLPLSKSLDKIFVAGKSANDIGNQSGGWTLSWQGSSGNTMPGTTILQGVLGTVSADTAVTYDRHAESIDSSYDAAIVVIGETPYAEGMGDIPPRSFSLDAEDIATLDRVKATGVPMVVVMISGRPLDISAQLPDWDVFVAAWLPGTEGAGVADVLFGNYPPTGKLPFTWPRSVEQLPINVGDPDYDPLFPFGFGLTYEVVSRPFGGTPAIIPGTVQMENYDDGGEGLAYHDIDPSNNGGQYRPSEGVDIEASSDTGGGHNIGWTEPGEWLNYSVLVTRAATYTLDVRVAASGAGGTFHIELDGEDISGPLTVPDTGGWQSWQTITKTDIPLPEGVHVLRVVMDSAGSVMGNFNYFSLTTDSETTFLPLVSR